MLKSIICVAALLTSMLAVADKSNGVGVDANGNYYVINGGYICEAHRLKQGKRVENWDGALVGIAGGSESKAIAYSLIKDNEASPEFIFEKLQMKSLPKETFYTDANNSASIRVNSKSIAIALGTDEKGTGILLTDCIIGT